MEGKKMTLLRSLYWEINKALWASLTAFVIFFAVLVLPGIRQHQAAYQAALSSKISAEADYYCRRFTFVPGTRAYRSCLNDLQSLRASAQQRFAAEFDF
jgi:hypothetical protein